MEAVLPVVALVVVAVAALRGWSQWLAFKHRELELAQPPRTPAARTPATGTRIELADLKERIRKLEAIAAGVDL